MVNKRRVESSYSISKRQKEMSIANAASSTKIDDVNLDCLEYVFKFLDLEDLINVAEGNKHLKTAANMAFNHNKYKKKIILQSYSRVEHESIEVRNVIEIKNLKFIFKILRLFGDYISNVWAHEPTRNFKPENVNIINYERIMHYDEKFHSVADS